MNWLSREMNNLDKSPPTPNTIFFAGYHVDPLLKKEGFTMEHRSVFRQHVWHRCVRLRPCASRDSPKDLAEEADLGIPFKGDQKQVMIFHLVKNMFLFFALLD